MHILTEGAWGPESRQLLTCDTHTRQACGGDQLAASSYLVSFRVLFLCMYCSALLSFSCHCLCLDVLPIEGPFRNKPPMLGFLPDGVVVCKNGSDKIKELEDDQPQSFTSHSNICSFPWHSCHVVRVLTNMMYHSGGMWVLSPNSS